jgi:hypothetical protein
MTCSRTAIGTLTAYGLLSLLLTAHVPAQNPFRWFGPKTDGKNVAGKSATVDPRRIVEIDVEIAWLADPVTFPYYLEAHVNNVPQLEVRGYVPNKFVRDHSLRLAQVYSSLPVIDGMKEHPSLMVRPSKMSEKQLQTSVLSSLRAALPKQYQQLQVECGSDGKVTVYGTVNSYEEKVAVSHSLRRLHGCTSVQNKTTVPVELVQKPPPADYKSKPWLPWSKGNTPSEPPSGDPKKQPELKGPILVETGNPRPPTESSGVIKVELPVKPSIPPAELQKQILIACPKAAHVDVTFTSSSDVRILIHTRSANDVNPIAQRIFMMPTLQNYRPELQFKIVAP